MKIKKNLFKNITALRNKDFSKVNAKFLRKVASAMGVILLLAFFFICFEIYVPINPGSHETITYTVQKGWGDDEIADNLQKLKIIRSSYFFKFYVIATLQHSKLQAGEYNISPKMSIYQIAKKMAQGDVIKDNVIILEGWDINDIGKYLESKNICQQNYFISLTQKDYSNDFDFLQDKPKKAGLEGYLFPDTYQIARGETCEDILSAMLANFDKKLTPDMRAEIAKDPKGTPKSIFDIVTMASMIEKEVRTLDDKKIVSGILWKRIAIGMPLQLDATVNYVTDKSDASVKIKDTRIDSPYNTYKYKGLPAGPISNPGIDSIVAAIYPKATNYWYYLSDGKTYFSETLSQHNAAAAKYLGH
ncbi:MAG: endolytic transglycosylase MltG [Candidatus Staskawiczbacteria bacterium]|nr:endolytic transglycosylase MltG [Candidatus Staskawiczbacteria bacterium]